MQDTVIGALDWLNGNILWGPPILILLVGTGVYLSILLRAIQIRQLGPSFRLALLERADPEGEGDISHFQALMTALSATVGTGNIVGVSTALSVGGPGALFWMWVTGVFGMATEYGEALLAVKYRTTDARGTMSGGPMYYLREGLSHRGAGRFLGAAFALFTAVAAFGIGNLVQSNSVAGAVEGSFGVPKVATGLVMAVFAAAVILGGIRAIGRVASVLVPLMIVVYSAAALVILVLHVARIPEALAFVFTHAFSGTSAVGGFAGAAVSQAIRMGVARGVFSNESGLGSGAVAAVAAQTREPVRQALVAMTQTFIDTIVVCTMTGLVLLVTGAWSSGASGAEVATMAFAIGLPGGTGHVIVAVSLALFAYSTLIGWSYIGKKGVEYLAGERAIWPYRIVFVAAVLPGALFQLDLVWAFADAANALMAIPNLIGLIALSGVIVHETRRYFERQAEPPA